MELTYFAYGSNLCLPRLRSRVPGVVRVGPAFLSGFALRWHKRSVDGSGKCSIVQIDDDAAVVHGALFTMPAAEKPLLDKIEGLNNGYEELAVVADTAPGRESAFTYVAMRDYVDESLVPYSWYRDLVASGAESQGLPAQYVDKLRQVVADEDPSLARAEREQVFVPCDGTV